MALIRVSPRPPRRHVDHAVWRTLQHELSATSHDAARGALLVAFESDDPTAEAQAVLDRHGWSRAYAVEAFEPAPAAAAAH